MTDTTTFDAPLTEEAETDAPNFAARITAAENELVELLDSLIKASAPASLLPAYMWKTLLQAQTTIHAACAVARDYASREA